jgi:hypothetical protein
MKTHLLLWGAIVLGITAASCSKGPAPPAPGSPAFLWQGAQTTYRAGDMLRTSQNLQQLIRSDNEFTARARPWAIVISSGVTQGYLDLADSYDIGAKANRANPMPFNKQASMLRSLASSGALELAESVHAFLDKDKDPNVPFAFEFPAGSVSQPPAASKISSGVLIQDSEGEALTKAMIQRGVLLAVCRAAGNPDDVAKTQEMMKAPDAKVPRATFLYALAKSLHDTSAVFGPTKLDRPDRLKVMLIEAVEVMKELPDSKDKKALNDKIQATLKKNRISI